MAPLYKRYIPSKPKTDSPAITPKPKQNADHDVASPTPEKKRKRERTQDEVAERKAKKLKKKGVEPTPAIEGEISKATEHVEDDRSFAQEAQEAPEDVASQKKGSMKKRHKLEKEARKAQKEAQKAAKGDNGETADSNGLLGVEGVNEGDANVSNVSKGPIAESNDIRQNDNQVEELAKDETSTKVKRKKRRKSEPAEDEQITAETDDVAVTNDTAAELKEQEDEHNAAAQPKKRRHKLEDVLAESKSEDVNEEDEDHLSKHTSVLNKFQKSARRSIQHQQEESFHKLPGQSVVRDLELPPPERTPTPEFLSEDAALPTWLAKPMLVSSSAKATFKDLHVAPETADRMSKLGFREALPVQQALVPLLMPPGLPGASFHPGTEAVLPDLAVSAPTGSGKTIAYLLPLIEALRRRSSTGKLSALIIVPTRELVMQVAAVAESLVKGSRIRVGMATGGDSFKEQQSKLIRRGQTYDPAGYQHLIAQAQRDNHPPGPDSEDFDPYVEQIGQEDAKNKQWIQDAVEGLVQHVPTYESAVDILVATPLRLLEHVNNTLGFSLVNLQWLVIDEADELLDNQYEGFLESLNANLSKAKHTEEQDAREKYLHAHGLWDDRKERQVRKVILSATMTRDISKLSSINLRRPKMIVVRDAEDADASTGAEVHESRRDTTSSVKESADGFELPRTLVEYCVPVGDGSEKPLIAVELLRLKILGDKYSKPAGNIKPADRAKQDSDSDSDSESDSDSDSDDSSSLSSDDSDSSSATSGSDDESEVEESSKQQDDAPSDLKLSRTSRERPVTAMEPTLPEAPTILIFTSSNESANRFSHLLRGLKPEWTKWITTLVKAKPGKVQIRSKANEPAIVVSTDRAARGLDSFSDRSITHIVQYDVPRSMTSYVHRVGRTARAGRRGVAWTLYTHAQGKWFTEEITKATKLTRAGPVDRVKVFVADDGMKEKYQEVLSGMRDEVFGASG